MDTSIAMIRNHGCSEPSGAGLSGSGTVAVSSSSSPVAGVCGVVSVQSGSMAVGALGEVVVESSSGSNSGNGAVLVGQTHLRSALMSGGDSRLVCLVMWVCSSHSAGGSSADEAGGDATLTRR